MNNWKTLVLGIFIGLFSAGLILLVSKAPFSRKFELLPAPTARPLIVHITGGIRTPGVYSLPPGSRVIDVVNLAGGLTLEANQSAVNLSAGISDGQKIEIPLFSDENKSAGKISGQDLPGGLINLNSADIEKLCLLPGIGPAIAADIVEFRTAHGSFSSIDQLLSVKGIGSTTFENIKDLVTLQ